MEPCLAAIYLLKRGDILYLAVAMDYDSAFWGGVGGGDQIVVGSKSLNHEDMSSEYFQW